MNKKLTIKSVSSFKPEARIYDVRDTEIPGFALRVRPSGTMTYLLFYRNEKGQKRTHTIGKGLTAAQARSIAQKRHAEVAQGIDINERDRQVKQEAEKEKATTLKSFLDNVYRDWLLENRKSGRDAHERIARSFSNIEHKQLESITSWDIELWRKQRKKNNTSDRTLKRDLSELKAMLTRAKIWKFIKTNPIHDFHYGEIDDSKIVRYLTDAERTRLYKALNEREKELIHKRNSGNEWRKQRGYELLHDFKEGIFTDHLKPIVITALNTGMRRGELFNLKWENLNIQGRQITVTSETSKNKKSRHIPLNKEAISALKIWKKQAKHSRYIFPSKNGTPLNNIKRSWAGLLKRAGITDFRFHDMRHASQANWL